MLKPQLESFFCNRLTIDLRKRKKEFTLLALLISLMSLSQTPNYNSTDRRVNSNRNSFWFEANLNGTISGYTDSSTKFQYLLDLQYRRMSDANYIVDGQKANIFADSA